MKTDDLIRALAQDAPTGAGAGRKHALMLLTAAGAATALAFALGFDVRDDLGSWEGLAPTFTKLAYTLLLLAAGVRGAITLMRPEANMREALAWLLAPLAAIGVSIALDIAGSGAADLGERAMGSSAMECLVSVAALSLLPLAAFVYGLRDGAPTRPGVAGALAGVSAGGLGASLYALHCIDDSPLFVGLWYGLAIALVAAAGAIVGRRALQW